MPDLKYSHKGIKNPNKKERLSVKTIETLQDRVGAIEQQEIRDVLLEILLHIKILSNDRLK